MNTLIRTVNSIASYWGDTWLWLFFFSLASLTLFLFVNIFYSPYRKHNKMCEKFVSRCYTSGRDKASLKYCIPKEYEQSLNGYFSSNEAKYPSEILTFPTKNQPFRLLLPTILVVNICTIIGIYFSHYTDLRWLMFNLSQGCVLLVYIGLIALVYRENKHNAYSCYKAFCTKADVYIKNTFTQNSASAPSYASPVYPLYNNTMQNNTQVNHNMNVVDSSNRQSNINPKYMQKSDTVDTGFINPNPYSRSTKGINIPSDTQATPSMQYSRQSFETASPSVPNSAPYTDTHTQKTPIDSQAWDFRNNFNNNEYYQKDVNAISNEFSRFQREFSNMKNDPLKQISYLVNNGVSIEQATRAVNLLNSKENTTQSNELLNSLLFDTIIPKSKN
ncbi:MAG: hypothetical protein PHX51_05915 [Clostridia bacterium]|nr:hypothetical protein [Clostridia bacterium]